VSAAPEVDEAEIVVVGAGPAGCVAAGLLAERGHEVLLVDKDDFPREKPCGDGLMHPAVLRAERLGIGDLFAPRIEIEATRIVVSHRRQTSTEHPKGPDRPRPRCVSRREFDAALLRAAQERGVRFRRGRVEGFEAAAGGQRIEAVAAAGLVAIGAGTVIAADGATSRLRRIASGATAPPVAYAVRRYFRTELPLDPVFQIDVPLEVDGRVLPGYGWIFPLDEHTANVGVGAYREPHRRGPSLRALLEFYVAELETKAVRRFGALEPLGEPLGSPVGIRSRIESTDSSGLALVGDAAGTTHPLTGEGIAFAMSGGEALADAVHARSRRRRGNATEGIWRSFPQLGVDTSVLVRLSMLRVNKAPSQVDAEGSVWEPFFAGIKRLVHESAYPTAAAGTPAWNVLSAIDPDLAVGLEETNSLLLERLADETPFVAETIHASIKAHLGPFYAAVVLAVCGSGAGAGARAEGGLAAESVGVLPELLTMLVDRARSKRLHINNAMAVLTGDFAATRALSAAAALGTPAVLALAHACRMGCQGGMRDAAARFATDRPLEDWFEAAREQEGAATVFALQLGSVLRGEDGEIGADQLQLGLELGVAVRVAEEIVDLTVGDGVHRSEVGRGLGRGIYPLPVLYAIEEKPALARLLARHAAGESRLEEILALVVESGGLERAMAECESRAAAARALAAAGEIADPTALIALASLPSDHVAARTLTEV
jgi:geranylgeranyl reductase family protein